MSLYVGSREARNNFSTLIGQVHYGGQTVIVEKSGKPMAAMIPIDLFDKIIREREARFQVLDRIQQRAPNTTEDELLRDVDEAIVAARTAVAESSAGNG